jgi:copper oxidase (laccase) domain-containing protein
MTGSLDQAALTNSAEQHLLWRPAIAGLPRNIRMACSTRDGGVSGPPFDSLNLAFGIGDVPSNVAANRRRFAALAGFELRLSVQPHSNGSDRAYLVEHQDVGRGAFAVDQTLSASGLVTLLPNVTLLMPVADDLPIFLWTADAVAIGLALVGAQTLAGPLLNNTVRLFEEACEGRPLMLRAAFGPSLGVGCRHAGAAVRVSEDLVSGATERLEALGVAVDVTPAPSTCCQQDVFFSRRAVAGGLTGRQLAYISRVMEGPPPRSRRMLPMTQSGYVQSCGG